MLGWYRSHYLHFILWNKAITLHNESKTLIEYKNINEGRSFIFSIFIVYLYIRIIYIDISNCSYIGNLNYSRLNEYLAYFYMKNSQLLGLIARFQTTLSSHIYPFSIHRSDSNSSHECWICNQF